MHQLYKDEVLRARLISKAGEQVQKFTWQGASERLWQCMMRCVPNK
jgi:hypothetical protein